MEVEGAHLLVFGGGEMREPIRQHSAVAAARTAPMRPSRSSWRRPSMLSIPLRAVLVRSAGSNSMHRAEGWYVLTVSRTRHCTARRPRQRSANGTVLTGPLAFTPRLAALLRNAAAAARRWIQLPEWRLRGVGDPAVVATE